VHTNASLLAIGAMLAQNPTGKYDQLIVYASRLLNKAKKNYITIKRWFMFSINSNIFCWKTNLFFM
jgi:hypothetical protein